MVLVRSAFVFVGLTLALLLGYPSKASALPVFAHRYGFSCQQCHTTIPNLNAFGEYFERSGFRLPGDARPTFPVAVKVNAAYSSASDPTGLPKAIVDEVEILAGGSLGRNTSYFLEQYAIDGGVPGRPRDMWIQFDRPLALDDRSRTTLRAKLGEFTLPLPFDPETQRPTLNHYALYDQTVGGNAFTFFDPRVGADLSLSDFRHGLEAHLVFAQAYDRGSGISSAGVDTMATLAKTFDDTWTATVYHYRGHRNVQPTVNWFTRDGAALHYFSGRWDLAGSLQHGFDTSSDGLGLGAASSGGYLAAGYGLSDAVHLFARYDDVFSDFDGRSQGLTLSLVTRPARNMRFTLEGTRTGTTSTFASALLFAY